RTRRPPMRWPSKQENGLLRAWVSFADQARRETDDENPYLAHDQKSTPTGAPDPPSPPRAFRSARALANELYGAAMPLMVFPSTQKILPPAATTTEGFVPVASVVGAQQPLTGPYTSKLGDASVVT